MTLLEGGQSSHTESEILASLVQHYLLKNVDMRTERSVNVFDFVLELLLGLRMLDEVPQTSSEKQSNRHEPEAEHANEEHPEPSISEELPPATELDRRMLGVWEFEWHWPYLNYCHGTLEINEKLREACYAGHLSVDFGNSPGSRESRLYEKATIRVQETRVRILCSEASFAEWQPDEFHLELDPHDDVMAGTSEHAHDIRGTIAFRKRLSA
jgi:hypothetical protein